MSDTSNPPIPVTLLTGFLGAGKTTLLNRILTAPHGRRVAVIVNEFGDANIDASLVIGGDDDLVQLQGGCLCCTVREDLRTTLLDLLARSRRRWFRRVQFDQVVIEASGMASPGPAVQTLLVDAQLAEGYRPAGVVTLAHAKHIERQMDEHPEAAEQVAYADRLILNHCDGLDDSSIAAAQEALETCNPRAPVQRSMNALVDVMPLLDLDPLSQPTGDLEACSHEGKCNHVHHTSGVGTLTLRSQAPIDGQALRVWLEFLGKRRAHELLRVKGVLHLAGKAEPYSLQGLYQWLELAPLATETARTLPEHSTLVLIGRNLDADEMERGWRAVQAGQPA